MAVNLRGTFLCSRAVHPGMLRKGQGSIVTVTSVTVELGMAGLLDYVASKAGIIGLTRALAREVGGDGISEGRTQGRPAILRRCGAIRHLVGAFDFSAGRLQEPDGVHARLKAAGAG